MSDVQPLVTVEQFRLLVERVDNLDAQIGLLMAAVEQVVEAIEIELVAEIDEALGDHPEVSQAMVQLLRAGVLKN